MTCCHWSEQGLFLVLLVHWFAPFIPVFHSPPFCGEPYEYIRCVFSYFGIFWILFVCIWVVCVCVCFLGILVVCMCSYCFCFCFVVGFWEERYWGLNLGSLNYWCICPDFCIFKFWDGVLLSCNPSVTASQVPGIIGVYHCLTQVNSVVLPTLVSFSLLSCLVPILCVCLVHCFCLLLVPTALFHCLCFKWHLPIPVGVLLGCLAPCCGECLVIHCVSLSLGSNPEVRLWITDQWTF